MSMRTNIHKARIEWGDCDPAGIIFYPTYFAIFDAATTALFERALGMNKIAFRRVYDFHGYPLLDTNAKFLRATRYGDDVEVESTISFGRTSFEIAHKITKDGELMVEAQDKRVWVVWDAASDGIKSHPVPAEVLAKFGV